MASPPEKVVSDAEASRLIRVGLGALVVGAVLLPVAAGFWMVGDTTSAMRLIAASSLGLILGFPLVGAIPPYLAGRSSGFSFDQVVRSPFRWRRGARGVRAFARIHTVEGVSWDGFATLIQFGADPDRLAEAIERRKALGYRVDLQPLLAAQMAGVDLVEAAQVKDALGFVKQYVASRRAEAERQPSGS